MPALPELLARRAGIALELAQDAAFLLEREVLALAPSLDKRILISCCNSTSPPGLVEAVTRDPWQKSGKYALGWVYFSVILLVLTTALRWYNYWNDKIRVAVHKQNMEESMKTASPESDYELSALETDKSTKTFFSREGPLPSSAESQKEEATASSSRILNTLIAFCRRAFYQPIRALRVRKGWRPIVSPSIGTIAVVLAALALLASRYLSPWCRLLLRDGCRYLARCASRHNMQGDRTLCEGSFYARIVFQRGPHGPAS
ncbi:hypothetical protein LTR56_028072 [Elasticomyces elasticus]|nr:hypothetical protein LTR56_028072 [Elasticomyces elasticus]